MYLTYWKKADQGLGETGFSVRRIHFTSSSSKKNRRYALWSSHGAGEWWWRRETIIALQ